MTEALIHARFALVVDMLDDLSLVADEETVEELRERTRELEDDYVDAFEDNNA